MTKSITLETNGSYPFTFYIEKAVATDTEKELIIEGVASTTNIDHDNERMSKEALASMVNIINTKGVPLRVEHSKSENAVIGDVFKGWVDERNQLHIQARLDKSHPVSPILHHSMKDLGKKMGFSVGGMVKRAMREFSEAKGKIIKTFYDVELKEVSVTPRPANYDSWAVAKSMAKDEVEAEALRGMFHDQFLFENPQMDYLQAFAKSVSGPEVEWHRTDEAITKTSEKDMTTETEEKEKTTSEDEDTTKAVSRAEFKVVVKSIETMTKAMDALVTRIAKDGLHVGPHDQNDPDKEKPKDESPAAKAASETEGSDTEGTREKGRKIGKEMDVDARDQNAPAKKKPEDESPAAKASSESESETREKTSSEDETREKMSSDESETREKAKDTDDTYEMASVTRSIKRLENITKRLTMKSETETDTKEKTSSEDETKEKASSETESETREKASESDTETEKGIHPVDKLAATVATTLEAMVKAMEAKGINVLGFEKAQVDRLVNDEVFQKAVQELMKIPGRKKSVVMGTPYMVTKSGKRFALTATEVGTPTIEKSAKGADGKAPSFKDVYKSNYSSVRDTEE